MTFTRFAGVFCTSKASTFVLVKQRGDVFTRFAGVLCTSNASTFVLVKQRGDVFTRFASVFSCLLALLVFSRFTTSAKVQTLYQGYVALEPVQHGQLNLLLSLLALLY